MGEILKRASINSLQKSRGEGGEAKDKKGQTGTRQETSSKGAKSQIC
jgi:hypothetical protein